MQKEPFVAMCDSAKQFSGAQIQSDADQAPVFRARVSTGAVPSPAGFFRSLAWLAARAKSVRARALLIMLALTPACGGCAVVAVADAAVSVAATAVKAGVKVVGAAVDAVMPDDDKKEKK